MHKLVTNAIFVRVPPHLKGMQYFDVVFFATIIHSPNPILVLSLGEIRDLSSITFCLVLPGFLKDILLIVFFALIFLPSCSVFTFRDITKPIYVLALQTTYIKRLMKMVETAAKM